MTRYRDPPPARQARLVSRIITETGLGGVRRGGSTPTLSRIANIDPREAGKSGSNYGARERPWPVGTTSFFQDTAIGTYLCDKVRRTEPNRCCQYWCDSNERRSQHHLVANCGAWAPRRKDAEDWTCGWKLPRNPSARAMFEDERVMEAI